MRFRNTIILLLAVAAVGVFIALYEKETLSTDEVQKRERSVVPGFKKLRKDIDRIVIDRPQKEEEDGEERERVELVEESKDVWRLTFPVQYRAEKYRITRILSDAEFLEKERVGEGEYDIRAPEGKSLNLVSYGLDAASAVTVSFYNGEEVVAALKVGAVEFGEMKNHYVMFPEDETRVFATGSSFYNTLTMDLADFRDKNVFVVEREDITGVRIEREGGQTWSFTKKDNRWEMLLPTGDLANPDAVSDLEDDILGLRTKKFFDDVSSEELAGYGLDKPATKITLTEDVEGESRDLTLFVGRQAEEEGANLVYAKRGETGKTTVFVLSFKYLRESLDKKADEYRKKKLAEVEQADVKKIELVSEHRTLAIEREGAGWRMTSPETYRADSDAVRQLIEAIRDTEIEDFAKPEISLESGMQIKIEFNDETREPERLLLARSGENAQAKRIGYDCVFLIDAEMLDKAERPVIEYRDRCVLKTHRGEITALTITRGDVVERAVKSEDGKWELAEPAGKKLDPSVLEDDLLWTFSDLRAAKLIADGVESSRLSEYGLDKPAIVVNIELQITKEEDDKETKESKVVGVHFGKKAEGEDIVAGARYAVVEGENLVFVATAGLVEVLEKGLTERKAESRPAEEKGEAEEGAEEAVPEGAPETPPAPEKEREAAGEEKEAGAGIVQEKVAVPKKEPEEQPAAEEAKTPTPESPGATREGQEETVPTPPQEDGGDN